MAQPSPPSKEEAEENEGSDSSSESSVNRRRVVGQRMPASAIEVPLVPCPNRHRRHKRHRPDCQKHPRRWKVTKTEGSTFRVLTDDPVAVADSVRHFLRNLVRDAPAALATPPASQDRDANTTDAAAAATTATT
jgi:hypothetical protein